MIDDGVGSDGVTAEHLKLGSILLELVSDWDAWVSRRVDKFSFIGDDERQLHRHQSMDFSISGPLLDLDLPLLDSLGGFPVPVTFASKWRLPQFSFRDSDSGSVSLLQREQSATLAGAMLIVLGTIVKEGTFDFSCEKPKMPADLREQLVEIASGDPTVSLMRCAGLADPPHYTMDGIEDAVSSWRHALLRSDTFMSLAYQFAGAFLMMGAIDRRMHASRRVLKFSHTAYVWAAERDSRRVRARHFLRMLGNGGRDAVDSAEWGRSSSRRRFRSSPSDPEAKGRLILSVLCEEVPEGLDQASSSVAAALLTIRGPARRSIWSRRQVIRLRPSGVTVMDGFPPGRYTVTLRPLSGYEVLLLGRNGYEPKDESSEFVVEAGKLTRLHLRARQTRISACVTRAPTTMVAASSRLNAIIRGIGWRSKPLAIRVRSGEGRSYHCEFEAPPGLHVTRGRLISNLSGNADGHVDDARLGGAARVHDLDMVLKSTRRAHLYERATAKKPSTAYALLNLRPRRETIVRPALVTAFGVSLVMAFIATAWMCGVFDSDAGEMPSPLFALLGFGGDVNSREMPWALLALLLGGPSALAAYVAQAVSSRVTNAMLWGLRLLALVPTVLSLLAVGLALLVDRSGWPETWLLLILVLAALSTAVLLVTYYVAEHPPEQGMSDYRQGPGFEAHYAAEPFGGDSAAPAGGMTEGYDPQDDDDLADVIRDRMLERIVGMTPGTRRAALGERWYRCWEYEVPPALYFDSAEAPAVFLGLAQGEMAALRETCTRQLEIDAGQS